MAAVSEAVTITVGDFIECLQPRAVGSRRGVRTQHLMLETSIAAGQPAIAVAAMTLIDSAINATARHSDRLTTASEAAAALANLDEAIVSEWLSKSKSVFRDPVMAVDPLSRRITARIKCGSNRWRDCGGARVQNGGSAAIWLRIS